MLHTATSEPSQQTNYAFVVVACVCVFIIAVPLAVAVSSLQRLFQPADSVLFGPTENGVIMYLVPTILIGLMLATAAALILNKWIRRGLGMPEIAPIPALAAYARVESIWQSINWRLAGGIAGVILMLVGAKGFGMELTRFSGHMSAWVTSGYPQGCARALLSQTSAQPCG